MELSKLQPKDLPERRPGMSESEWVIEMVLARKGSKAHRAGVHILTSAGSAAIPLFVDAAVASNRKPAHRIRLLDLILEIGGPLDARDYSELLQLLDHRSKKVRDKAYEVLTTLCPTGPPPLIPPEILQPVVDDCRRNVAEVRQSLGIAEHL